MSGLLGKKLGMTRIFREDGQMIPVTLIEAGPCPIVQLKTIENDGYHAVQLGFQVIREKLVNKPRSGHFQRAGVKPTRFLREFRNLQLTEARVGDEVKADVFKIGDRLDVTGYSKGRGFAGVMKRHNFKGHKASHGTHESFRGPGSIGSSAWPSRVWRGMKMAGRMGNERTTIRNLEIVRLEAEKNLIMVRGAVPGPNGCLLELRKTKKK